MQQTMPLSMAHQAACKPSASQANTHRFHDVRGRRTAPARPIGLHHSRHNPVNATARTCVVSAAASVPDFASAPTTSLDSATQISAEPGVYAVYDASNTLQYVGISRKVVVSVSTHLESLGPEVVAAV